MNTKETSVLFQKDDILLAGTDEELHLADDLNTYRISSHSYEPCTYILRPDGKTTVIHNAFDVKEIYDAAENGATLTSLCGHEYDTEGICRLLLYAAEISQESFDIAYLEGRYFISILSQNGAVSADTALDLETYGLKNHNIMNDFIHAKRIRKTSDNKYYIVNAY